MPFQKEQAGLTSSQQPLLPLAASAKVAGFVVGLRLSHWLLRPGLTN